jgi:hypothetical protein
MTDSSAFEEAIYVALQKASKARDLSFLRNAKIGEKPGGLSLSANWMLTDTFNQRESAVIISRFQGQSGSTEEKLISVLIRLKVTLDEDSSIKKAWLLLGGDGWTREYISFINNKLQDLVPGLFEKISVISNRKELIQCDFSKF